MGNYTNVVEPTGWKHVRATYANITHKLDSLPGNKDLRLAAIDYWRARLNEDAQSIANGGEAFDAPADA